jgi:hypothetical protein
MRPENSPAFSPNPLPRTRRSGLRARIIGLVIGLLVGAAMLVYYRVSYDRYAESCQPIIRADEQVLADIAADADYQKIQADLSALSVRWDQWKPPPAISLGKGPLKSLPELNHCESDLSSYAWSASMLHVFQQNRAGAPTSSELDDMRSSQLNNMRAYANSARGHLEQAKTLLAERQ